MHPANSNSYSNDYAQQYFQMMPSSKGKSSVLQFPIQPFYARLEFSTFVCLYAPYDDTWAAFVLCSLSFKKAAYCWPGQMHGVTNHYRVPVHSEQHTLLPLSGEQGQQHQQPQQPVKMAGGVQVSLWFQQCQDEKYLIC